MAKLVREFVNLSGHQPLGELIDALVALRKTLPADCDADVRMQGDDVFGRRLSISFLRPQTEDEVACDERYQGGDPRNTEPALSLVA